MRISAEPFSRGEKIATTAAALYFAAVMVIGLVTPTPIQNAGATSTFQGMPLFDERSLEPTELRDGHYTVAQRGYINTWVIYHDVGPHGDFVYVLVNRPDQPLATLRPGDRFMVYNSHVTT